MTKDQKDRIIEKIIDNYSEEDLFHKLNLDIYEIFFDELNKKNDDQLLELLLD